MAAPWNERALKIEWDGSTDYEGVAHDFTSIHIAIRENEEILAGNKI